jgi:hypothetical protein
MNNNLRDSIKGNLISNKKPEVKQSDDKNTNKTEAKFKLSKKKDDTSSKKAFNVYMESNTIKDIDKVAKKSGYSRNELINIMCKWCLDNLEFTE